MTVKELTSLYDYGYWANSQLLDVISELTPEEFTRTVAGSYGSVRNTLVHALSAEWGWLARCGGPERGARLNAEDYPTLESVTETWARIENGARELLSTLNDTDLERKIAFKIDGIAEGTLSLGQMMHHGAIHGIHHRGQVALLLRLLGYTPGNFDILFYYNR